MSDRLLTVEEAAARLRASVPTLARWRSEGTGPRYSKIVGRVYYSEAEIATYLESCVRTSTRDSGPA